MIETLLDRKATDPTNPQWSERFEAQPFQAENPTSKPSNIRTKEDAAVPEFTEGRSTAKFPHDFNSLLVESINETIISLLSVQVAEALYAHLHDHYSITKDEIPYHLDTLLSTLQKIFGSGGRIVGKAMAKRLYSHLNLRFEDSTTKTLLEYLEEAKAMLQTSSA